LVELRSLIRLAGEVDGAAEDELTLVGAHRDPAELLERGDGALGGVGLSVGLHAHAPAAGRQAVQRLTWRQVPRAGCPPSTPRGPPLGLGGRRQHAPHHARVDAARPLVSDFDATLVTAHSEEPGL
jgi:hypothetical protein